MKEQCESCEHKERCKYTGNGCTEWKQAKPKLERCGRCGGEPQPSVSWPQWRCTNGRCGVVGPTNDTDGSKWNAMSKALRRGGCKYDLLREYMEAKAQGPGSLNVFISKYDLDCGRDFALQLLAKLDAMGEADG